MSAAEGDESERWRQGAVSPSTTTSSLKILLALLCSNPASSARLTAHKGKELNHKQQQPHQNRFYPLFPSPFARNRNVLGRIPTLKATTFPFIRLLFASSFHSHTKKGRANHYIIVGDLILVGRICCIPLMGGEREEEEIILKNKTYSEWL